MKRNAKKPKHGDLVGTIAYYGSNDKKATKLVVGIIRIGDEEPIMMKKWFADNDTDLQERRDIKSGVLAFLGMYQIKVVAQADHIMGCPHEEGIDYPEDESCPLCPFWKDHPRKAYN